MRVISLYCRVPEKPEAEDTERIVIDSNMFADVLYEVKAEHIFVYSEEQKSKFAISFDQLDKFCDEIRSIKTLYSKPL